MPGPFCHAGNNFTSLMVIPGEGKGKKMHAHGYRDEVDQVTGERIAWDRAEDDCCERGTPGCSIHHTRDSECQTW